MKLINSRFLKKYKYHYFLTDILPSTLFVCLIIFMGVACKDSSPQETSNSHTSSDSNPKNIEERLRIAASVLNLKARDAEPAVTTRLQELATRYQGNMRGLKHRLKTQSSTIRKLNKLYRKRLETSPKLKDDELVISDALRYTLEVDDVPPGRYVEVISTALKELESEGHQVVKVKNYWPRGDNYSGVNTVLRTASGLEWELQFHTPESYQEASRSHGLYEQLRAEQTPLKTRQELFNKMSAPWETIKIPAQVLEPQNLHASEVIKQWSAPTK